MPLNRLRSVRFMQFQMLQLHVLFPQVLVRKLLCTHHTPVLFLRAVLRGHVTPQCDLPIHALPAHPAVKLEESLVYGKLVLSKASRPLEQLVAYGALVRG